MKTYNKLTPPVSKQEEIKNKKLLITGANGLVGSAVMSLENEYPEFKFIPIYHSHGDLTNQQFVRDLFDLERPDIILHLAGSVGGIGKNLKYPVKQYLDNIQMNVNVISEAFGYGVKKLIAFSSVCVFPKDLKIITENDIHSGEPFGAHWFYAHSKRQVDILIEAYRQEFGSDFCSLIPCNIFGENDNYNLNDGHIVPSIIHKFYKANKEKTDVECWGDGSPTREFIYSKDLAKVCLDLLSREQQMPQRLVVPGKEMTIKEMVDKIDRQCQLYYCDYPSNIIWNKDKPNGQMKRPTKSLYFDKLFPNFQHTDIDHAIKESVKWFNLNYDKARK